MTEEPASFCDLEVWPLYDGENITIGFTDGQGDSAKDLLAVTLSHDETKALIDILSSAIKCETSKPTYSLRCLAVEKI